MRPINTYGNHNRAAKKNKNKKSGRDLDMLEHLKYAFREKNDYKKLLQLEKISPAQLRN